MSGATVDKKKGVLELTKLEYPKKWYFPTYFTNSVFGPNISTIDTNGPFWPNYQSTKEFIYFFFFWDSKKNLPTKIWEREEISKEASLPWRGL